jgi:hypothetical protein
MIEMNEVAARFVEVESSLSAIELADPVLVPPCDESP